MRISEGGLKQKRLFFWKKIPFYAIALLNIIKSNQMKKAL